MRTLYLFNMITLDGYFEGPDRNIDWHRTDNEFNDFAVDQLNNTDMLLFGRVTYELMASYWPTEQAKRSDPVVALLMNTIRKAVVSRTLRSAEWENTQLITEYVKAEIDRLKRQPGKDIAIFGSAYLANSVSNLIDEYRIIVNPVILGSGRPLFPSSEKSRNLSLKESRTFANGNVLLYYHPTI